MAMTATDMHIQLTLQLLSSCENVLFCLGCEPSAVPHTVSSPCHVQHLTTPWQELCFYTIFSSLVQWVSLLQGTQNLSRRKLHQSWKSWTILPWYISSRECPIYYTWFMFFISKRTTLMHHTLECSTTKEKKLMAASTVHTVRIQEWKKQEVTIIYRPCSSMTTSLPQPSIARW